MIDTTLASNQKDQHAHIKWPGIPNDAMLPPCAHESPVNIELKNVVVLRRVLFLAAPSNPFKVVKHKSIFRMVVPTGPSNVEMPVPFPFHCQHTDMFDKLSWFRS